MKPKTRRIYRFGSRPQGQKIIVTSGMIDAFREQFRLAIEREHPGLKATDIMRSTETYVDNLLLRLAEHGAIIEGKKPKRLE